MILPIVALGHPTLRKVAKDIPEDFPERDELVKNMFETMYHTNGVGLAAPQVNHSLRLFMVDASPFEEHYADAAGFKQVFINPYIIKREGDEWAFNEGCLSVPDINEDVMRPQRVLLQYETLDGEEREEWFEGIKARIIQHEYDHLQGIVFVDHISSLRRVMLKRKLKDITSGVARPGYRMIFGKKK